MKRKLITIYTGTAAFFFILAVLNTCVRGKNDIPHNIGYFYEGMSAAMKIGGEILPGNFLLAAILVLYIRKYKIAGLMLAAAGAIFVIGRYLGQALAPAIALLPPDNFIRCLTSILLSAFSLDLLLVCNFLPALIAVFREKTKWKWYALANLVIGWIPPVWVVMLFLAFRDDKDKKASEDPRDNKKSKSESKPVRTKPVHQRLTKKRKKRG